MIFELMWAVSGIVGAALLLEFCGTGRRRGYDVTVADIIFFAFMAMMGFVTLGIGVIGTIVFMFGHSSNWTSRVVIKAHKEDAR